MNLEQVAEAIRAELDWRHWGRPGERMQYMRRCGAQKGTSIDRCEECRPMREALATCLAEIPRLLDDSDRLAKLRADAQIWETFASGVVAR